MNHWNGVPHAAGGPLNRPRNGTNIRLDQHDASNQLEGHVTEDECDPSRSQTLPLAQAVPGYNWSVHDLPVPATGVRTSGLGSGAMGSRDSTRAAPPGLAAPPPGLTGSPCLDTLARAAQVILAQQARNTVDRAPPMTGSMLYGQKPNSSSLTSFCMPQGAPPVQHAPLPPHGSNAFAPPPAPRAMDPNIALLQQPPAPYAAANTYPASALAQVVVQQLSQLSPAVRQALLNPIFAADNQSATSQLLSMLDGSAGQIGLPPQPMWLAQQVQQMHLQYAGAAGNAPGFAPNANHGHLQSTLNSQAAVNELIASSFVNPAHSSASLHVACGPLHQPPSTTPPHSPRSDAHVSRTDSDKQLPHGLGDSDDCRAGHEGSSAVHASPRAHSKRSSGVKRVRSGSSDPDAVEGPLASKILCVMCEQKPQCKRAHKMVTMCEDCHNASRRAQRMGKGTAWLREQLALGTPASQIARKSYQIKGTAHQCSVCGVGMEQKRGEHWRCRSCHSLLVLAGSRGKTTDWVRKALAGGQTAEEIKFAMLKVPPPKRRACSN